MMTLFNVWIAALCTLAIMSFLYRENRFYRLFEHIFLGLSFGYGIVVTWTNWLEPRWLTPLSDGLHLLFSAGTPGGLPLRIWLLAPVESSLHYIFVRNPAVLWLLAPVAGSMYYFIFSRKYNWVARILIGLFIGTGAGLAFRGLFAEAIPQIVSSFKPLYGRIAAADGGPDWGAMFALSFNHLLFMATLLSVLVYFSFGFRHDKTPVRQSAAFGRLMLMVSFGAIFGTTVMGRMALLIDRLGFLYRDWFIGGLVEPIKGLFS